MLSNFLFSKPKNVGNAKCRPTIDRVSTNYWPIHRSSIDQLSAKCRQSVGKVSAKCRRSVGEVSAKCRRSVGEVSAKCQRSVGERKAISAETHLERLSTVSRPSVVRLSSESRPTIDRYIDRVSTDYRPLYRPIDRSTLPTVNMIEYFNTEWVTQREWSQYLRIISRVHVPVVSKDSVIRYFKLIVKIYCKKAEFFQLPPFLCKFTLYLYLFFAT